MYLNLIQIAESFGVSEKVVEDWIRAEDMPHVPDRGRVLFDRAQVANWAAQRGLATHAGFLAPENPSLAGEPRLEPLLRVGGIWRDITPADVTGVYEKIVAALPGATPPIRQLVAQRLRAPGGVTLAPIGGGLALPHPSTRIALGRGSGTVALLLLRYAVADAGPPDDVPVTRLFFFLAPSPRGHLDLLARISRSLARGPLRDAVLNSATDDEIFGAAAAADRAVAGGAPREAAP